MRNLTLLIMSTLILFALVLVFRQERPAIADLPPEIAQVGALTPTPAPPPDEETYLAWLADAEARTAELLDQTGIWIDLAASPFPKVPNSLPEFGTRLLEDWANLVAEINAQIPPEPYADFHREFAKLADLGAQSAQLLNESIRTQDPQRLSEAAALHRLALAALELQTTSAQLRATSEPVPSATPTPVPQPTPALITAEVLLEELVLRAGPGEAYPEVATLPRGTRLALSGRNPSGSWVWGQVIDGETTGWLAAPSVAIRGNIDELPVVAAGPAGQPTATSTPPPTPATWRQIPTWLERTYCLGNTCLPVWLLIILGVLILVILRLGMRLVRPQNDLAPPMAGLEIEAPVLATPLPEQTVTFTAHVPEETSNIPQANGAGTVTLNSVQFRSPSGHQQLIVGFSKKEPATHTLLDDTYISHITLPAQAERGIWRFSQLVLQDNHGNQVILQPDQIQTLGFPMEFIVE